MEEYQECIKKMYNNDMTMLSVQLDGKEVYLKLLRRKGMRHVKISLKGDGSLIVSAPRYIPKYFIVHFITTHKEWIVEAQKKIKKVTTDNVFLLHDIRHYKTHKEKARALIHEKVCRFNAAYGFAYNTIFIKNQRSIWGSCSRKKNLNFNYKILFLPDHLQDYIIVHEICHLKEFNHGKEFWKLVGKCIPDYKERKREIVTYTKIETIC